MDDPKDWNPLILLVAGVAGRVLHVQNQQPLLGWLHRRFPWMLRPRTSLLIFAMCFACSAIVLLLILLELPKLTGAIAD
jgi:hypothetical protein